MRRFISKYDDVLHLWFSGYLETLSGEQRRLISPDSFGRKIIVIFKELLKDVIFLFICPKFKINSAWLVSETLNNKNSLYFLNNELNIPFLNLESSLTSTKSKYTLQSRSKIFYDLIFPFILILFLLLSDKRAYYLKYVDLFFKAFGRVEAYSHELRVFKPKLLVFANDHNVNQRSLLLAAKSLRIKTVYIQHASISTYFPPLLFDYSLLEGVDSLKKYTVIGKMSSSVQLVGMPKLDNYLSLANKRIGIKTIGICFNQGDDLDRINNLITFLLKKFPDIRVLLRPHPSDKRSINSNSCVLVSNSKAENSFEFLSSVDCIIAGESSILLEATLFNVLSINYNMSSVLRYDYYGFIKNGVAIYASSDRDLYDIIKGNKDKRASLFSNAKEYNDVVNTPYFGKSQAMVIESIKKML